MYATYEPATDPDTGRVHATGWLPPLPDFRDFTQEQPDIGAMAKKLKLAGTRKLTAPARVDLRQWCSPAEDQRQLGSCTAHAAVGIVEYFERRAHGKHVDGSRLFVYKTTRKLMGVVGDTGAWLRNTMGALVFCGVPPEKYWPYTDRKPPAPAGDRTFDDEPPAFLYAVGDNYETLKYFCHDPAGRRIPRDQVLASVNKYLAAGVPSMFGFFGFRSSGSSDVPGGIPHPCPNEQAIWGHAVAAVGYDDALRVKNTQCNQTTKGALLIRNSWGTGWGDHGYGWLPYDYVLNALALDFWSLLSMEWVDTKQFGL